MEGGAICTKHFCSKWNFFSPLPICIRFVMPIKQNALLYNLEKYLFHYSIRKHRFLAQSASWCVLQHIFCKVHVYFGISSNCWNLNYRIKHVIVYHVLAWWHTGIFNYLLVIKNGLGVPGLGAEWLLAGDFPLSATLRFVTK